MNERVRTIVAGIALVHEDDPHLAPAGEIARATGATLHLVHAYSPDPFLSSIVSLGAAYIADLDELRSDLQSQLEARAQKVSSTATIVSHVVPGPAADAILDVALERDADLVVVGTSELGTIAGMMLGTTAQRVLRASRIPTVVISGQRTLPWRRVLITTDLSELSARVHERALALVAAIFGDAEIEMRSLLVAGDGLPLPSVVDRAALEERAQQRLGEFLDPLNSRGGDVQRKIRSGSAAREIVAEAAEWNADLIVLGTHGRTGASRFMIGSVAETVIRKAPCDLLVIPAAAFA